MATGEGLGYDIGSMLFFILLLGGSIGGVYYAIRRGRNRSKVSTSV